MYLFLASNTIGRPISFGPNASTASGVMRRLLLLWLCGLLRVRWGVLPRWAARVISDVSSFLLAMRDHIPTDFCRQPRSLTETDRWKATEFRLFLLHCGPVVLKGILPDTFYKHFLLLFVASTILTDKNLSSKYTDYASSLLQNGECKTKESAW